MLQGLTGWHLLLILAVIVLLFGAAKLPALAKSVGQSARVFKGEMKAMKDDDTGADQGPKTTDSAAAPVANSTTVPPNTTAPTSQGESNAS